MPLTVYRRGDIWHYRGTVAGRRLRGSTKTSDKRTAQRVASEIEARQWKGHLDGPASVLTFAQAAILYRAAGKPPAYLDRIEDYWKNTPVASIRASAITDSAAVLYPRAGTATWNRKVVTPTQAIINFAAKRELCPRIHVERFKVVTKIKTPTSWDWIKAFMAHSSPHLGALACFMFLTGARISEATALTWDDVNLTTRKAIIRQTKTGTERVAHLPPELVVAMAKITDRQQHVFKYTKRGPLQPWNATIRRAGLPHRSFHACRHGFATAMLHAGVDPITTAKRGGWKSPQHVFNTYGHASEDETITERITGTPVTQRATRGEKDGTNQ